jgi:putative membrane-bound dehydrogenase-like protein
MKLKDLLILSSALIFPVLGHAEKPKSLDPNYRLELFADNSMVSTPVGCTIDKAGRVLVVESHTHFRPDNYEGPKNDRILAFSDKDNDGKADKVDIYHEGETHTMSIKSNGKGSTYVATRAEIFRLDDNDNDGIADSKENLITLKTPGKYPHNGLCGLVLTSDHSRLYFGLGENLGKDYEIISYSGQKEVTILKGGGEGGNIYSYSLSDGSLSKIATGFWNPFGICLTKEGEMFAVDNDPDQKPPNRLLKIVPGGDYGYQFRYGRPGTNPLQAWDGELPGTLPMICGTGEAACSVIPYGEHLWVSSWALGQIEEYKLTKKGSNYSATMKTIVKGDANFRPVDFAHAEDGSVFFTDWVNASYQLHGQGKVWKLIPLNGKGKKPEKHKAMVDEISPEKQEAKSLKQINSDRFELASFFWHSKRPGNKTKLLWESLSENSRIALLTAAKWDERKDQEQILKAINGSSKKAQIAAIRIIADENMKQFREPLEKILGSADPNSQLFKVTESAIKELKK